MKSNYYKLRALVLTMMAIFLLTGTSYSKEVTQAQKDKHGTSVVLPEVPEGSSRAIGDDCTAPIVIGSFPYSDVNTTQGRLNNYSSSCMGSYDNGEDIIYQFTIAQTYTVTAVMNPGTTTYSGIAIMDACPMNGTCLAIATGSDASIRTATAVLTPGTYYIMIDTYASPDYITSFTLNVTTSTPPPLLVNYGFLQSTGTYSEITGGVVLGNASVDDQYYVNPATPTGGAGMTGPGFEIGFPFIFNETTYDRLGVNTNGWISLGHSALGTPVDMTVSDWNAPISTVGSMRPVIAAFTTDLQAKTGSIISLETIGTAPNRVCVIQWKDYARFDYTTTDNINFQIRLYESTNKVEYVYGSMSSTATTNEDAQVGISMGLAGFYKNRQSSGGWMNTVNGTSNTATVLCNNVLFPQSGLTYTYDVMSPMTAQYISPANGAIDIPLNAPLVFAASNSQGSTPDGFRLYMGTDNPPTNMVNGTVVTSPYTPAATLATNTIYNWQVVPFNEEGDSPINPVNSFRTTLGIGTLQGFVTNGFGIPISGATIALQGTVVNYSTTSAANGSYQFVDMQAGTYTATVSLPTYNNTVMQVVVAPSITTYQNFVLTRPSMAVTPNPYNVSANPNEQVNGALNVNNNGDGVLGWNATVSYTSPGPNTWLTLSQTTGSVNPYSNFDVPVVFNAAGLTSGTIKTAQITFTSTPNVGTVVIPVTLTVSGNPLNSPTNLVAVLSDPIDGVVNLTWSFETTPGLQYFLIRRDGVQVGTTMGNTFSNNLPAYGVYNYTVQAVFAEGNSAPAGPVAIEWANPVLVINPTSLYNEQYPMTSENVSFRISNTGEGTLAYEFPEYLDTDGAGGPDAFGYEWIDSDEPNGPAYVWNDISATGTAITGFTDDNVLGPFNLGISFPFYENVYTTVNVSSNGYLVLGNTSSAYSNVDIPNTANPNNMIAWFWNDLTGGGQVRYQTVGDHFVIQFNNYPDLSGTGTITAQIHLYQNGDIKYFYNTISSGMNNTSSTIGIENATGTIGTKIAFNTAYVHNGLAVTIKYPVWSFITAVSPAQGQVPAGGFVDVVATFTANEDYPVGTHNVELELNTNDLNNGVVMIPATMVVYNPGMLSGTVTSAIDGSPIFGVSVVAGPYATMTDENGNYSMTADAGTYTMTFSKTGFGPVTVTGVVVTATQTTDVDAILDEVIYPPTLVHAEVNEADTQAEVTWGAPTPDYEVLYDDGGAENYTAWALAGNMNGVKFTPAGYPATVYGGKIYVGDGTFPNNTTGFLGTTFGAAVMDDDGTNGTPGTVIDSIEVTVNNYGWVEFSGLDAVIEDGSFYLVMIQGGISPNIAPVGVDETTPTSYKSYSRNVVAGGVWALSPYQDMMIRAFVNGPAADDNSRIASNDVVVPVKQRGMISLTAPAAISGTEGEAQYIAIQGKDLDRSVTGYKIWRAAIADPNAGAQSGVLTQLNPNVTTTNYTDGAFGGLPEGWYAYAVAANYTTGGESAKAYSNIVGHRKLVEVTFHVSLTTGGSPAGAVVSMTGLDYPYSVYSATVPEDGTVVFEDVIKGNYNILAQKVGFDNYTLNPNIQSNRTFDIILAETKYAPTNLYVDPLTLVATWRAPMQTLVSEDFEGATFPPAGWGSYTQNTNGWYANTVGSSAFVIPPHTTFAVANDDEADGDGCCDYLWTPVLDLTTSETWEVHFQSFFNGAYGQTSSVEVSTDNGATWTVVQNIIAAPTWQELVVDLTEFAGPSGLTNAVIGFHTNDNGSWASGWAIDDVRIKKGVNPSMGYGVFLDGTLVANTPATTYTYTNLNYGQEYLAGVAGLFSSGYSELDTYLFRCMYLAPPTNLQGENPEGTDYVHLTWEAPMGGGGAGGTLFEDFEAGVLSEDWEIIETNSNTSSTPCYWTVNDFVSADFAPFGMYHAGLWWDYDHQDEWLITPEVNIGAGTTLTFETTVYEGSVNGDHYYVKISTDGGETWTSVWDASTLTGNGWNYYDYNYSIDLSDFAGESVKIAFNAVDGDGQGLWYIWFVDNIGVATATDAITFRGTDLTKISKGTASTRNNDQIARDGKTQRVNSLVRTNRAAAGVIGYNVYRDAANVAYVEHPTLEYFDLNLEPGTYSYHITAVYDLTPYGYPGQTGESMIEGPITVPVVYGFDLPFVEEWTTGLFETNEWTVEGTNWRIAGQAGNPAPAVEFTYAPVQDDYTLALTSAWINGLGSDSLGYIDGDIYLDFDLKLDDNTATGDEKLTVQVYNGDSWSTVGNFTAEGDMNWTAQHIKITNAAKNRVFRVRFVANGVNTLDINNWQIDNINIYRLCAAPLNLTATIVDPVGHGDQVLLEWEAPSTPQGISGWIKWDDGLNAGNGIGLTSGGTFFAAARFTPDQLSAWEGTSLTKIRMFPFDAAGCTFVLKVWTGANAGTLVASQPVNFTSDQWNEYSLNNPVYITGTTEVWFGYEVTHAANQFPAGTDDGPAVAGFGDMISSDGGATWDPLSSFGPDFNINWNIQGFVETMDGVSQVLTPITNNVVVNNISSSISKSPVTGVINPNAAAPAYKGGSRAITGYNIFRRDEFIATTTETEYLDTDDAISILGEEFCYNVTAIYEDCESDFSNDACATIVDAENIDLSAVNIYPNPSNNVVNIELTNNISQVVIYNYAGQVVYEQVIAKDKSIQLDVRSYNAGAYLVKFITRSGESFARKIAVTK